MDDLQTAKEQILAATPDNLNQILELVGQAEDIEQRAILLRQLVQAIASMSTKTEREQYIQLAKQLGAVSSTRALRDDVEREVRERQKFAREVLNVGLPGGQLKSSQYIEILTDMGYTFRMLELDETLYINGQPASDGIEAKIRAQMRDAGYKHVNIIRDVYVAHAFDNQFNPIKDYLTGLRWDGKPRIDELVRHFEDTHRTKDCSAPLLGLWVKKWMAGAIAKVLAPNGYQNPMLVLVSSISYNNGQVLAAQGKGKSYWASWMCSGLPDYFLSSDVNPRDKDYFRRQLTYFIWEVDELGSTTKKSDVEALKSFITTPVITIRPSYARNDIRKRPMASFVGTVNDDGVGFLPDTTGNRRFLTVEITNIDFGYTSLDVDQIWAEAFATLYNNSDFHKELSEEERRIRDEENSKYGRDSTVADYILIHYDISHDPADVVETNQLLEDISANSTVNDTRRALEMEIAKCLKAQGLVKKPKPSRWLGIKEKR